MGISPVLLVVIAFFSMLLSAADPAGPSNLKEAGLVWRFDPVTRPQ